MTNDNSSGFTLNIKPAELRKKHFKKIMSEINESDWYNPENVTKCEITILKLVKMWHFSENVTLKSWKCDKNETLKSWN